MTIPFWCVFGYFAIIYLTRVPVLWAHAKAPEGWDNRHPRDQQARFTGWARRAHAAHQNGFELFGPFAAAVIITHLAGCDPRWMNGLSLAFLGTRALYPILYIADLAAARSLVWMAGFGCVGALYLLPLFR